MIHATRKMVEEIKDDEKQIITWILMVSYARHILSTNLVTAEATLDLLTNEYQRYLKSGKRHKDEKLVIAVSNQAFAAHLNQEEYPQPIVESTHALLDMEHLTKLKEYREKAKPTTKILYLP